LELDRLANQNQAIKRPIHKWLSLLAINLGNFVPPLDTGILIFILPVISVDLNAPVDVVIWVPLISLLIEGSFMPIFGKISDRSGRKRYFILGLALFSLGSFLAGNSLTVYEILIYRTLQGFGGAFILANGRALIADTFEPGKRGFAFGTHVTTIYIAQALGPALAGSVITFTSILGWRYVFFISGTVAALVIPIAFVFIKESPKRKSIKVDWMGALLFATALLSGLATIIQSAGRGINTSIAIYIQFIRIPIFNIYFYPSTVITIPLVWVAGLAVITTALFLAREALSKSPQDLLIDPRFFTRNRIFLTANTAALLLYVAHYGSLFLMSFYLQIIKGFDPLTTGLILMTEPVAVTIFALIGGTLSDRVGTRDPSIIGLIMSGSALLLFAIGISQTSPAIYIVILLATIGAGVGLFAPANTNATLSSVTPDKRGVANGILGMIRHTGQSLSLALGTALIGIYIFGSGSLLGGSFTAAQYVGALQINFFAGAILMFLAVPIVWRGERDVNEILNLQQKEAV
jgi:MFS family permease